MPKAPAKLFTLIAYLSCQRAHKIYKMEDAVFVTMLTTGDLIQYTVLSFPVFKAMLREVNLQWEEESRTIQVFDTFARDCNQLDHHLPAMGRYPLTTRMPLLLRYEAICYP